MTTYRFTLEYDGTDFEGWQLQPGAHRTVQGCFAAAIEKITGTSVRVLGSGRTDSGVHAEAQVATSSFETRLSIGELRQALNGTLPSDLAVREVEIVEDGFDPRRAAKAKRYRYCIWNASTRSPLRWRRWLWMRHPLDVAAMQQAASLLVGTHDFASFQAAGSNVQSTVRTLHRIDVSGTSGGEIEIEFEGSGFLRYMVRNIVGTLLEVGRGRRAADDVGAILAARDRSSAGRTAPPQGLTLVAVRYGSAEPPRVT